MEVIFVSLMAGVLLINLLPPKKPKRRKQKNTPPKRPVARPVDRRIPERSPYPLPVMPRNMALQGYAHIIDGDTICIKGTKIRLAGIDAPELDRPWGQKSKWAMVNICKGQIITAELDGERSYDRLVGTCYLPDGRDIGAELIKLGLALDLPRFSMGKYRHLEPQGARQRLGNGRFGHASIRFRQQTTVMIKKR